jgi:SAM-dependent methyltransferase
MADSRRERVLRWPLIGQGALVGAALGVLAAVGARVFVVEAAALLVAIAAVGITLVAALAVGLWAGAPTVPALESRLRARWFAAGLTVGVAGAFASFWEAAPQLRQSGIFETLALVVMAAAPAYALGLLLPSLLAWAEQWEDVHGDGEEPGGWEPLGTLVASVLGGAALGLGVASLILASELGPGPVLLGTGAALILPTLLPEPTPESSDEQVLYEVESPLGTIRVVEIVYPGQRQPERRLYVNDEEESGELVRSGAPTLAYIAAAEQWFAATARRGDSYLFLGGGAYTLPRRVAERDPQARITVVELDPEVTRVAHQFFGMRPQLGIRTIHGDARAYLDRAENVAFERIFVDVYAGQESLPYSLVTREAFERLARLLRPEGVLTINAIGITAGVGERRFWSLVRTISEVFPSLAVYTHLGPDHPERQNVLLVAAREPGDPFPARAGLFDRWPTEEWPAVEETLVFRDLFPEIPPDRGAEREIAKRAARQ